MTLTAEQKERLLYTGYPGSVWGQAFTRSSGSATYDAATLLVQIRQGETRQGRLIASSVADNTVTYPYLSIDTTGTNLTSGQRRIVWTTGDADTGIVVPQLEYWLEVEVAVNGEDKPRPILRHRWYVPNRTARRPT